LVPANTPPAQGQTAAETITGTLLNFNYDDRGSIAGLLVTTDKSVAQINLEGPSASRVAGALAIGDKLTANVTTEAGPAGNAPADHPIYRAHSLVVKGNTID